MGIRLKLLVACLAFLFLAQVGWWGYTIWNQGESKREATLVGLETRKEAAHATWEAAGGTARSWESIAVRFSGITLIEVDGQPRLKIEEAKLSSIARDRDGMRRMLFAEGGFFLLLAIGFLLLLFRAIQMEARLSREHTRFLHTVTHELRTPLQALKLASETLALENSPEKTREYAEGMLQDTHRLEALVDRVLVAGRLEAGMADSRVGPVNLSQAVENGIESWKKMPLRGGGSVVATRIASNLVGQADPSTLPVILGNLLDNAVKFGQGNPIKVSLQQEESWITLRVRDHGLGIPDRELSRVFERFWRGDADAHGAVPGTGLGLHIVEETARLQGALVEAHSEGEGQGAEFVVRWSASEEALP